MPEHDAILTENPLSEREMEVARLLVTGASNAEIARDLVISPHTVKVHLRNIFEKLQVSSRTEASMVLVQRGWIVVPGAVVEPTFGEAPEPGPPPLPEPAPLSDAPATVMGWQRAYLIAALAICLLLLLGPYTSALISDSAELLTNAEEPIASPSALQLEPRWRLRTPLRQPVGRHALVVHNGHLVTFGGETTGGETLRDVAYFDLERGLWTALEPLPTPLANLAAAALGQTLYVAGGSHRESSAGESVLSDQLLGMDDDGSAWRVVSKLPYPVAGAALVADATSLYLIGGWDGQNMRDEIWRYAPAARTGWELVGHLANGRAFMGATAIGGDIFVAGGYDGERESDRLERFTPLTGETHELASMATPRGGLALVYDGVALYAVGGGWTRTLDNLERYDLSTGSWSNFPSPLQGEWRNLAAAGGDGQLYITGGWAGDYIDSLLEYQSSFRALLPVITTD